MHMSCAIPPLALEEALRIAGVGCWLWHPAGGTLRVSANFHRLLDCPDDALPASSSAWLERTHPDDRQQLATLFERLQANQACGQRDFSLRLKHGNGQWHWFKVQTPEAAPDDPLAPVIVTFKDFTRERQSEAALHDAQFRFRALYNTAPLAFIQWDRNGYISEWNRHAEKMFGWTAADVIGKRVHHLLLPPDTHAPFAQTIQHATHGKGNGIFVGPALGKDGRQLHCSWYNVALRASNGKLLGILSLVLDATEQHLAHQQLEKSENVYRTLVETSPDAILLLDPCGRLQKANQQAQRLFGLDEMDDPATSHVRHLLSSGHAADGQIGDLLANPEEFIGFIANRQLTMRGAAGRDFDAATSFTTIMDADGQPSGIVLFVRDVTGKLLAERELEAYRAGQSRCPAHPSRRPTYS